MPPTNDDLLDLIQIGQTCLAKGRLSLSTAEFRRVANAGAQTGWPDQENFLRLGFSVPELKEQAEQRFLRNHFFSQTPARLERLWHRFFADTAPEDTSRLIILSRIAWKRLMYLPFEKAFRQCLLNTACKAEHVSDMSTLELKSALFCSNLISAIPLSLRIVQELVRRNEASDEALQDARFRMSYFSALPESDRESFLATEINPDLIDSYFVGDAPVSGKINIFYRASRVRHSPTKSEASNEVMDRILEICTQDGIPVAFRRAPCNPTRPPAFNGAPSLSFHTIAENARPEARHIKDSHLKGIVAIDTHGYSGWGQWASAQMADIPSPSADRTARLKARYVESLNTYARAPTEPFVKPAGKYVALFLQLESDTTQVAANVSLTQAIETVCVWGANNNVEIVIKRHPSCESHKVAVHLNAASKQAHVHISKAHIHDIACDAICVVTCNSGSGFEVLLQGKTVITTGGCDYRQATHPATTPRELRIALNKVKAGYRIPEDHIHGFVQAYIDRTCIDTIDGDLDAQIRAQILTPLCKYL